MAVIMYYLSDIKEIAEDVLNHSNNFEFMRQESRLEIPYAESVFNKSCWKSADNKSVTLKLTLKHDFNRAATEAAPFLWPFLLNSILNTVRNIKKG